VKERTVRLVTEHRGKYSTTAAAEAVKLTRFRGHLVAADLG